MSKYVIKNCPSCTKQNKCIAMYLRTSVDCKEIIDCVLKQTLELCKHYRKHSDCGRECPSFGRFLDKLLDKLDIQEV